MSTFMFLLILLLILPFSGYAQPFDEETLESIVRLEGLCNGEVKTISTGFLLNYSQDSVVLVTCRHVVDKLVSELGCYPPRMRVILPNLATYQDSIRKGAIEEKGFYWIADQHDLAANISLGSPKHQKNYLVASGKLDIAVLRIAYPNSHLMGNRKTDFNSHVANKPEDNKRKAAVTLGEEVYFIGYPMSPRFNEPIVRSGSVAWKSEDSSHFLLEGWVLPANSGSPVFTKRDSILIGMVYRRYEDSLKQKVEANLGLVRCHWFDDIYALAREAFTTLKSPLAETTVTQLKLEGFNYKYSYRGERKTKDITILTFSDGFDWRVFRDQQVGTRQYNLLGLTVEVIRGMHNEYHHVLLFDLCKFVENKKGP